MSNNYIKHNLKARQRANSSLNDLNSSVRVKNSSRSDINSSLNNSIMKILTRSKRITKYLPNPKREKNDVTGAITHFFMKQAVATNDNSGYYIDLSNLISDLPSRKPLAFFVPDNSAASQAVTIQSSIAPQAHLSATRGQTIISKVSTLSTDYDGLTLQNKIAERRICGAVSNKTESKTRHPILLPYSVAFTQNLLGVIHHG